MVSALDHTPNDIWAIHSIAHIYEETQRPREGLKLLSDTESQWQPRHGIYIRNLSSLNEFTIRDRLKNNAL